MEEILHFMKTELRNNIRLDESSTLHKIFQIETVIVVVMQFLSSTTFNPTTVIKGTTHSILTVLNLCACIYFVKMSSNGSFTYYINFRMKVISNDRL